LGVVCFSFFFLAYVFCFWLHVTTVSFTVPAYTLVSHRIVEYYFHIVSNRKGIVKRMQVDGQILITPLR